MNSTKRYSDEAFARGRPATPQRFFNDSIG